MDNKIVEEFKRCASDPVYLRTGDLGFLWDNELFVVGRLKDVLIINGQNLYPQDVELCAVQSHAAVRAGGVVAFSVMDAQCKQKLHVVCEIKAPAGQVSSAFYHQVVSAIKKDIFEEFILPIDEIALVKKGGIQKTTSGKVQRSETKNY